MSMRKLIPLAMMALALWPAAAFAHGDISSSIPKADETLKKAPDHLIINFTEPPAKSSVVLVKDGCGTQIADSVDFEDRVAHVFTEDGQPGKWKISYKVLSTADGHKSSGSYGFTVDGKKDCTADDNSGGNGNGGTGAGGGTGGGTNPQAGGNGGDEGSFPVVPVAIGSVGVIGLALVARRLAG